MERRFPVVKRSTQHRQESLSNKTTFRLLQRESKLNIEKRHRTFDVKQHVL